MKCTQSHSAQGTNHHRLFSGPVCEWDFYGRGRVRHHCICRHTATPGKKMNKSPSHSFPSIEIFLSLSVERLLLIFFQINVMVCTPFCLPELSLTLFVLVFFWVSCQTATTKKAFSMIFFYFSRDTPLPSSLVCYVYIFLNHVTRPYTAEPLAFTTASFCLLLVCQSSRLPPKAAADAG